MQIKKQLRKEYKIKRRNISGKAVRDKKICGFIESSDLFLNAKTILFYAAADEEVNLDDCICSALRLNKTVALPVCEDNNGAMSFYIVKSFEDLAVGSFGIREPSKEKCEILTDYKNALCVVPGIAYDYFGFRIGYGKGYYDRFLQKINVISLGVCYNDLIAEKLPVDKFDLPVDYLVTENGFISIN